MIREISKPKLNNPVFIAAWPGMGEVAYRTALFLKEALRFRAFAKLEAKDFFPLTGVVVKDGILNLPAPPAGFFYHYTAGNKQDIILFIGEAQPPLEQAEKLVAKVIQFAKKYNSKSVWSFAAKPEQIDHKSEPKTFVCATHKDLLKKTQQLGVSVFKEGQVSGLNGLILGAAKKSNLKGAVLLGEIPLYTVQIENPKASLAILKVFNEYFSLSLDLAPLEERAKFIEEEIERMISYIKGEPAGAKPLDEEDIDKIKKDLAAYTKLPHSARDKIEQLFSDALKDIGKARHLKDELDRWNVYREYEDRFLELFKRGRGDIN